VPGTLTVTNVAPSIAGISLPGSPAAIKTNVTASVNFTDPGVGTGETYTATFDWGDGTTPTPSLSGTSSPISTSHTYTAAGVYTVKVTVTDSNGLSSVQALSTAYSPAYAVIYDPSAGYVTGGGWINSPTNACNAGAGPLGVCSTNVTGTANFGFSSQYKQGSSTPTGNTEFQFQAGNLNFHSSTYAQGSLVVSGSMAQYKGTGTINGQGSYTFTLWACDAQLSGSCQTGVDGFRIQIKTTGGAVVYDNVPGGAGDLSQGATQPISGGSITTHSSK
jgi:hypothetical protein